jgi:hypothetical protein
MVYNSVSCEASHLLYDIGLIQRVLLSRLKGQ